MASLLERLDSRLLYQRQTWKSTPRPMKICFYAAVFSVFASLSVMTLLMRTTYLSPLEIFLNIVIQGGFGVAFLAALISQRFKLIPVAGILAVLFTVVVATYPTGSQLIAAGSPIARQLKVLGNVGIVSFRQPTSLSWHKSRFAE